MSNELREYYGKANPMIPTGRTRRRFFGTQYEYEGPVRQDKSHNLFNIDKWPRGLVWRYRKPERMPFSASDPAFRDAVITVVKDAQRRRAL